ncbi:MAG: ATP-binding protein [Oscillatoriaceae bacterium SKW80]|nr:ATP-binding protein [Oscillatoriaceae bacterium SKYG93]MCX8121296.1 ATP-binding protein [Oscillatoriaceae bacterium SKW80]MDW8453370.1 ATP-binding protein [Oscillatoriaceae cyanobacterium SKYGB_i_bin93]HIK26724.1 GAF domain-containing protein [Oscillatoriaceae cyanobacterium M7585_C2015_266]
MVAKKELESTYNEEEPIHLTGCIQPHGLLFVLKEPELKILQVSDNTAQILGIPSSYFIDRSLITLLDNNQIEQLRAVIYNQKLNDDDTKLLKLTFYLPYKTIKFDAIIHRTNGGLILELEPSKQQIEFINFYNLVRTAANKIQSAPDFKSLCQALASEVRKISGFDRVMVYKFDEQGHGCVIAEDKLENLPSYEGLHYPSSDIPPEARRLYCLNWLRLIADVNYKPAKIIPAINPITYEPIDLTYSVLRSISPCHIEYLQNMGVSASMSISLMKGDKLWGLIACHHYSPRYVAYEVRKACEFLGQVMSLELSSKEESEDYEYQLQLKSNLAKIIEYMSNEKNYIEGLFKYNPNVLDLANATGAFAQLGGKIRTIGKVPPAEEINKLIEWLNSSNEEVFSTDCLTKIYKPAEEYKEIASGILAICISKNQNNYVIWFRTEVIKTVNWAGNPKEIKGEEERERLNPRKSFELWKETVRGKSLPWKTCEIETAKELKNAIIKIVLRKAEELEKLNAALIESEKRERERAAQLQTALQELKRTQTQLVHAEKMSSLGQLVAGLAHEINNPVNFIYGNISYADKYSQDLIQLVNLYAQHYPQPVLEIQKVIEDIELEFLLEDMPKLLKSMKVGVDRIRDLVLSLRNFARLDEAEKKLVNIHEGIDSTLLILSNRLKVKSDTPGIQLIKEYGDLPLVECFAGQMNQVFMNVLANAIDALEERDKQRSLEELLAAPSQILIRTKIGTGKLKNNEQYVIIIIADNGPGIPEEVQKRLFEPFFTTKPVGKGTGLGLAISYQIVVDKHGGNLKCFSQPGKGTEFWIEIPVKAKK